MLEAKVKAAAQAAAAAGAVITPIVLYLMVRLLGEDAADPLVLGVATSLGAVPGLVALWWGWRQHSTTSATSAGYDPTEAAKVHQAATSRPTTAEQRRDDGQLPGGPPTR